MEVDQVIKILKATSRRRKSLSKSSAASKRTKKSFIDSFEERFWVISIFCLAALYLYLWMIGKSTLIHEEVDIFHTAHSEIMPSWFNKTRMDRKSKYERYTEQEEFKIGFDRINELESEFMVRDAFDYNYKQFELFTMLSGEQEEVVQQLENRIKTRTALSIPASPLQFYSEIIKINFNASIDTLHHKIRSKIIESKRQINGLQQIKQAHGPRSAEANKLLVRKNKLLKSLQEEFKLILKILADTISRIPQYCPSTPHSATKLKSAKVLAFESFFNDLYKPEL